MPVKLVNNAAQFKGIGTPGAKPPAGEFLAYFKADGRFYRKNDAGVEAEVNVTTDLNDKTGVTAADTTPNFLASKIQAGANIALNILNPGADEKLEIVATDTDENDKVGASVADTTPDFLSSKLTAGANITLNLLNPGADEEIEIVATDTNDNDHAGVTAADTTPSFLASKIAAGANITLNILNPGANEQLEIVAAGGGGGVWEPPEFNIGAGLTSGASFFLNAPGAGYYLSFAGTGDDIYVFNYPLHASNGEVFDGSDLTLKLFGRISSAPGVGDDVGLVVDYGFQAVGDNSVTNVTNVAQQDFLVDAEVQDIQFDITLANFTGGAIGDEVLSITITRNSSGGGADTYPGNLEIIGAEILRVP